VATENSAPPVRPVFFERFTALLTRSHGHPIAVHTPNGVLPLAIILAALGAVLGRADLIRAGWYNLVFVALIMPVVLFTGFVDRKNRYRGAKTWVFRHKIIAGFVTTAAAGLIAPLPAAWPALLDPSAPARFLFPLLIAANLAPAAYAGYLGARLVFGGKKP
jgi:uncharacterized membrane protein